MGLATHSASILQGAPGGARGGDLEYQLTVVCIAKATECVPSRSNLKLP